MECFECEVGFTYLSGRRVEPIRRLNHMANHGLSFDYQSMSGMELVCQLFVFRSMDLMLENAVTDQRLRELPYDSEESSNLLTHN